MGEEKSKYIYNMVVWMNVENVMFGTVYNEENLKDLSRTRGTGADNVLPT